MNSITDCHKRRNEADLIRMAVAGHEAALDILFSQYRSPLYQRALRLCGNPEDAEDALQDGMFSAFRHLHSFQARSQFSTWLTRIVINATLMRMRERARRIMISVDGGASNEDEFSLAGVLRDTAPDPEAACAQKEALELLRRRLQCLPQSCQEVVWLRHVHGFSTEETANTLRVSKGAIKSLLHRARAKLAARRSAPVVAGLPSSPHTRGNDHTPHAAVTIRRPGSRTPKETKLRMPKTPLA